MSTRYERRLPGTIRAAYRERQRIHRFVARFRQAFATPMQRVVVGPMQHCASCNDTRATYCVDALEPPRALRCQVCHTLLRGGA